MGENPSPRDIARQRAVYQIPGMEELSVRRDVEYKDSLTMDLYYPPADVRCTPPPAVVIVAGYPDDGFQVHLGCRFKELGSSVSWGQLIAASGMVAITYTNLEPQADLTVLVNVVRQRAADLGIAEDRLGVWASSGNVPLALSLLMQQGVSPYLKCAVLGCGYTLDLDGATGVAEAARMFGFANPCAGKSVKDLPQDLPLFLARAGQDQCPRLNESLDRFLTQALARNLPLTFVNHPQAPHSFDLFHDSQTSRQIIRQMLAFLRFHLSA
jgi:hypothetical protein